MKLPVIIFGFLLTTASWATPLGAVREAKVVKSEGGEEIEHVIYRIADGQVLVIQRVKLPGESAPGAIRESYFWRGELVLFCSWRKKNGHGATFSTPKSGAKDLVISVEDLDGDGLFDQVLFSAKGYDPLGFKRRPDGEMEPIVPVIAGRSGAETKPKK